MKNNILIIKELLMDHIEKNTIIKSCHGKVSDKGKVLPYAVVQRGGIETTRDICNIKDIKVEFGIRIVAGSEDDLYEAIEQITLMWNKTGIGSLFQQLHEYNVMALSHRYDQTGLIDSGEVVGQISLFLDIRQQFRNI